jgi:hypothetical protein
MQTSIVICASLFLAVYIPGVILMVLGLRKPRPPATKAPDGQLSHSHSGSSAE